MSGNFNTANAQTPYANGEENEHRHTGQYLSSTTTGDYEGGPFCFVNDCLLSGQTGTVNPAHQGLTDYQGSGLPFVQVLACRVTNVASMEMPPGGMIIKADGTDTCPGDFTTFFQAEGRYVLATPTNAPQAAPTYVSVLHR